MQNKLKIKHYLRPKNNYRDHGTVNAKADMLCGTECVAINYSNLSHKKTQHSFITVITTAEGNKDVQNMGC